MKGFLKNGLNIQIFAGEGVTLSAQAKQDKYGKNAKIKYGLTMDEEKQRILSYMQKNQSGNHERFAFYVSGDIASEGTVTGGVTDNGTNTTVADKTGASIKDFFGAVFVTPTKAEVPFYRDEDDDDMTNLSLEGALLNAQASRLCYIAISKILAPLKTLSAKTKGSRTITVNTKESTKELTLHTTHEFGAKEKSFYENEDEFFAMLAKMEHDSVGRGMESEIALFYGEAGSAVLKQYDRTSNNDYITTGEFMTKQGKKLAIKKFDVAEMVPIRQFDALVGKNYIIGVLKDAMGYDSKGEPKAIRKELDEKGAIFYNIKEYNGATIVDIDGIYIFEYNGKIGSRTPTALP